MEFDDPRHAKLDKHAAQHGKYPDPDPTGHFELLKADDELRQATNFQSKFSDTKDPSVWGPGFMNICGTIAAIHMGDMSAQTNMLILNHREDSQSVLYVQLEDIGPALPPELPQLLAAPPTTTTRVKKQETAVKHEKVEPARSLPPPVSTERAGQLLKARRAQMMMTQQRKS